MCCTQMTGHCLHGSKCRLAASHGATPTSTWAASFAKPIKPDVDKVVALGKIVGTGWGNRKRKAGDT